MMSRKLFSGALTLSAVAMLALHASARSINTAESAGGADVEFRESEPTTSKDGPDRAVATRVSHSGNRNSLFYLRFGIGDVTPAELADNITVQLHSLIATGSANESRFNDRDGVDPLNPNVGFDYYVLDPARSGNTFVETTITPFVAKDSDMGYSFDGVFTTSGAGTPSSPTDGLTYLGNQKYPDLDDPFPKDTAFNLTVGAGSPLHTAIQASLALNTHNTVSIVVALDQSSSADQTIVPANWNNFNYQFHSKETSVEDYANSSVAPSLEFVPEPASLALLGIACLALASSRRRD